MKPIDLYIHSARKSGKSNDEIKSALMAAGWDETQAREALGGSSENVPPPPPPPVKKVSQGSYAWYTFEHILMFISLAVLTVSIALILNHFVDRYFPKVPVERYGYTNTSFADSSLRGYLAALIVSLPLFSFLFLDITKNTLAHPEIRNLLARKLLIYLTMIVTFVTVLGYVITTVYNLLGGNVSLNFALHLLVAFATAGVVFTYYLFQVKEDRRLHA